MYAQALGHEAISIRNCLTNSINMLVCSEDETGILDMRQFTDESDFTVIKQHSVGNSTEFDEFCTENFQQVNQVILEL